ncbi:MAG: PIN domain-containing protein [Sulfurovum sp.]
MSIKIYIDTNIYLNSILNRDEKISQKVLSFLSEVDVELYLNDLSIINIHYIIRKHFDREYIKNELKTIQNKQNLVSIDKEIIEDALDSAFKDFEDGVQYYCAKRVNAELIITDNIKDYKHSDIRVISAIDFYDEFVK